MPWPSIVIRKWGCLSILGVSFGCADSVPSATAYDAEHTGNRSRPVAVFPLQAALAELPSLPPPPEAFSFDAAPVDRWNFSATPEDTTAKDDTSPWGELSRSAVAAHDHVVRLSPQMRCAAVEVARFYVERQALPTESLRRFTVARCGGTSPYTIPIVYGGAVPDAVTDAVVFERAKDKLRDAIDQQLASGRPRILGVGTYRAGGRFAAAAILGSDELTLDPAPRTLDESRRVVVRGTLRVTANEATAYVNRGQYGADICLSDTRVKLPAFAFSCVLAEGDKWAWMQILVRRERRVLEDTVADLLLSEPDVAELEYRARSLGASAPVSDAQSLASVLFAAVNKVRADGHLAPLSFATKQSEENARLAGTFIDASIKGRDADADAIALGLVAGWNIEGLIRGGQFFTAFVSPTRDATEWLDFALERPFGRRVLLQPDARRIAIGSVVPGGGKPALGAVVTTYELFESMNHEGEAIALLSQITAARKQLGRPALASLRTVPELVEQAKLVLAGEREPYDALGVAVNSIAQRVSGQVEGSYVETNDLAHTPIPEAVLRASSGALAVLVTHHRVKGAAWGQYVVLYVLVHGAAGTNI